jgi:hypothetical protein
MTHSKLDIITLFDNNFKLIDDAIRIIGENQTADELGSKHTKYHNGIGFTSSYGTIGTVLYQFVTGRDCKRQGHPVRWAPKSLVSDGHILDRTRDMRRFKRNNPKYSTTSPYSIARMIAELHWRQLGELLNVTTPTVTSETMDVKFSQEEPKGPQTVTIRFSRVVRQTAKAVLLEKVDAEGIAWERWIPKSMIVSDLGGGEYKIKRPA